jgi:hypothetical protein
MSSLDKFSDFQYLTHDIKLTGPQDIINEATLRNYLVGDMLTNRDESNVFRGGKRLTERIQAYDNNGFQAYLPNEELTPVARDTIRYMNVDWRFVVGNYAWNDNEVLLNEGDPNRYGDLKYEYESGAVTSIINGMESLLCNVPNTADMEAAGGRYPYSFPCFVQEGAITSAAVYAKGALPYGFSTVMGVDSSTETWWQNQTAGYTNASIETADSSTGLFTAFDKMMRVVKFDKLKINQAAKYWENDDLRKMRIYTSGNGRDIFMRLLRSKNNRLTVSGPQDAAYPDPRFDGYPVDWIEKLDTAPLYGLTGTAGYGVSLTGSFETTATGNGIYTAKAGYPRFYFLNFKYMYVVFHAEKYFQQKMMDGGARQPFSHVMYFDTYYNLVCRSRRRQGIIQPTA